MLPRCLKQAIFYHAIYIEKFCLLMSIYYLIQFKDSLGYFFIVIAIVMYLIVLYLLVFVKCNSFLNKIISCKRIINILLLISGLKVPKVTYIIIYLP